ncbi:urease accessory protein, partial [Acinetobacter baumannii]
ALKLKDEQLSSALPRYAMLSMKHETQYSRLFRS